MRYIITFPAHLLHLVTRTLAALAALGITSEPAQAPPDPIAEAFRQLGGAVPPVPPATSGTVPPTAPAAPAVPAVLIEAANRMRALGLTGAIPVMSAHDYQACTTATLKERPAIGNRPASAYYIVRDAEASRLAGFQLGWLYNAHPAAPWVWHTNSLGRYGRGEWYTLEGGPVPGATQDPGKVYGSRSDLIADLALKNRTIARAIGYDIPETPAPATAPAPAPVAPPAPPPPAPVAPPAPAPGSDAAVAAAIKARVRSKGAAKA